LYLTDAIAVLNVKGETVLAQVAADFARKCWDAIRVRIWPEVEPRIPGAETQRAHGCWRPRSSYRRPWLIDPDVTAGEDTIIEPGVQLLGKTKIARAASFEREAY